MNPGIRKTALSALVSLIVSFQTIPFAHADADFAVESFTKYDRGATSYTVPATVNFAVVKKASSDFVIWTRDELTPDELTVIESYVRAHDASLGDRNAIFVSGTGSHVIDTMYGTVTFEYGDHGLTVSMPREWSHLDYGRYTDEEPPPGPDPKPGKLTIRKTVNGRLWRVRCDYMDVEGQDTCGILHINDTIWKRDWITNPEGITSAEGHRLNKCGDDEHWVIWVSPGGVAYRMDEIKSGATGSTLSTVVYRTREAMTDEEIANIGNSSRPECLEKYKQNFQETMSCADIEIGKRLYWITTDKGRIWYHTGIPYEAEPTFTISVDGVPYVLTGGQSVTIPDLEPGIHEISELEDPLYSLGAVVSTEGGTVLSQNGWSVQIYVDPDADVEITWPNLQPEPPTPPVVHVDTLCELLDFGKLFNAVIFGDLTASGGDSEGNLLVWGSATLPSGYSVGFPVVGEPLPAAGPRDDALIVGGDLVIGYQGINGNIVYGGDYLGVNRTWSGSALRHVAPVTLDRAGNVPADGSGRTAADLLAAVTEVSSRVADMESNGTVTIADDGCLVLSGTDERRNVFSVTAEEWSGSQRDWIFDVPAGSKAIVNVAGDLVEIANGRMVLPEGMSSVDVLVNYVDATMLTFSHFSHEGSVLAPFASGSFTGGSINGIAVFGGDVVTKGGFEFHNFHLDTFFCPTLPEVTVTATAASSADGDILDVEPGTLVEVTVVVSNPSEYWLRSVTLTDSTGATIALGDIAPGGSVTTVRTLTGEALVTYSATVTAAAYASADATDPLASRPSVTGTDVAVVNFAAAGGSGAGEAIAGDAIADEAAADGETGTASTGSTGTIAYNPTARVDYKVSDMWFSCVPTFAGETFTVNVRVENNGEIDGSGAFLGLYLVGIDHAVTVAAGEDIEADRVVELGGIPAGSSRVYSFSGLTAPDASGVCRVIAYADMDNLAREWSKGDNQDNLTYELSQVAIRIAVAEEGVTLTWSNGWGQIYSILGSNDLENWDAVITDIPSARDTDGLVENTQFVGFDTGYHFFKLRIDQR